MATPFYKQMATSVAIGVVTSLITVWLLRKLSGNLSQPPAPAAIPTNAAAGASPLKGLREKGIPRNEF